MQSAVIVTYTTSGATALRASRERPDRPILGLITRMVTARKLALAWGVHPVHTADAHDLDEMVAKARQYCPRRRLRRPGREHRHHRRPALRHARRHQPAARRLGDLRLRTGRGCTVRGQPRELASNLHRFWATRSGASGIAVCSRPRAGCPMPLSLVSLIGTPPVRDDAGLTAAGCTHANDEHLIRVLFWS